MKQEVEEQQDFVKEVTKMSDDFDRWYTDVVRKAELADWSGVRGMMVVRPYGWAMWEAITRAFGKLHVDEILWQDPEGRMCVRGSKFAAVVPVRR